MPLMNRLWAFFYRVKAEPYRLTSDELLQIAKNNLIKSLRTDLFKAEQDGKEVIDAYLRLRNMIPNAKVPQLTALQLYNHTERCLQALLEENEAVHKENAKLKSEQSLMNS